MENVAFRELKPRKAEKKKVHVLGAEKLRKA